MSKHPVSLVFGIVFLNVSIAIVLLPVQVLGHKPAGSQTCLMCHSAGSLTKTVDGTQKSLYVDPKALADSVHGAHSCVDCHADLRNKPLPHKPDVAPVSCESCHDETQAHPDTIHRNVKPDENPPKCWDCHGYHGIRPVNDSGSPVHPANSVRVCLQCHTDPKTIGTYKHSIHGAAASRNGLSNAGCTDCHSAHKGYDATSPLSCASCHADAHDAFSTGVHGTALQKGSDSVPTCATCHGGHDIREVSDPRSSVALTKVSGLCAQCHENHELMQAHDLPSDRLRTYDYSYHGKMLLHGNTRVATCVSCHQAHDILSAGDPRSSTHIDNLPETCGKCHTGASLNWTDSKMHVAISAKNKDILYYVSFGFKWLTIGVMSALIGHIILDLVAHFRGRLRRYPRGRGE